MRLDYFYGQIWFFYLRNLIYVYGLCGHEGMPMGIRYLRIAGRRHEFVPAVDSGRVHDFWVAGADIQNKYLGGYNNWYQSSNALQYNHSNPLWISSW